jgi:type VI secretion system protein ImpL
MTEPIVKNFKKILLSREMFTGIGVFIIALLIWFAGPAIRIGAYYPLDNPILQGAFIVLVTAVAILVHLGLRLREARLNSQFGSAVLPGTAKDEVDEFSKGLAHTIDFLKKSRIAGSNGRRFLYQLPWYIVIGPPGAGKSAALRHSKLKFLLPDETSRGPVKGEGGTKLCDWWIADDAVLIDTAGRYTTQESNAEQNKVAWLGFLERLKQYRPRQPLNGVICAIGIREFLEDSEANRSAHAQAIKRRVLELYRELKARLPVYVLFTKADVLAGFVEFFHDLKGDDRDDVWGITFDLAKENEAAAVLATYPAEFDNLVGCLNDRLIDRLQQEADSARRGPLFGFPQQFASLKAITETFLGEIFEPNRFEDAILLRGVYFTSSIQQGKPIDRLMSSMAATFGLPGERVSDLAGDVRSYFLNRLLRDVVFGEAGIVKADERVERRHRRIRLATACAAGLIAVAAIVLFVSSYRGNMALAEDVATTAKDYAEEEKALEPDILDPANLQIKKVLDALNRLGGAPADAAERSARVLPFVGPWPYGDDQIGKMTIAAYRRALGDLLLPRLLLQLEGQLKREQANADFPLFEMFKIYLMLGADYRSKLDKGFIKSWLADDWDVLFPDVLDAASRRDLDRHLDALLNAPPTQPIPKIDLDPNIVLLTRATLQSRSAEARALADLQGREEARKLAPWLISDHAGPAPERVLRRSSGRPLTTDGVPGLYTREGFYTVFLPLLPDSARGVASQGWVLGRQDGAAEDAAALSQLQNRILDVYLDEFEHSWDRVLRDVSIAQSGAQDLQALGILAAADSPLKFLMISAADETWLSKSPATAAPGGAQAGPTGPDAARAARLLGAPPTEQDTLQDKAKRETDIHFKAYHDLADGAPNGPRNIDAKIAILADLYTERSRLSAIPNTGSALLGAASTGGAGAAPVRAAAAGLPEPMKAAFETIANGSSAHMATAARGELSGLWKSQVLPKCQLATDRRYPMDKSSKLDVPLGDFVDLFGKGGKIDGFFSTNLAPFVDTSIMPWRWQKVDNRDLGIPQSALTQFELAKMIRDSMIAPSGRPEVNFSMALMDLDPTSTQVLIELGGQRLSYSRGSTQTDKLKWPAPDGAGYARVTFQPEGERAAGIMLNGDWGWFRLLDQAQIKQISSDVFDVTFLAGDRSATFEIRADSVTNPFSTVQLSHFRCPPSL